MSYKCKHFAIHELVPQATYKKRKEKAWQLMDDRLLITIDRLRALYGEMTINNYHWKGTRNESGLRTPDCKYYSQYSQHTYGRAVDIVFTDITAERVRQEMLDNPDNEAFEFITSFELGTSWLHIDCRNVEQFFTFYP